jgi:hypothetical protein
MPPDANLRALSASLLSLPQLIASWRAQAAEHRAQGDAVRAEAIERCAADLAAVCGGGA